MAKQYWLMKTEPTTFSWDDLMASPDQTTCWEGVRNYQARNLLRDTIKVGDGVLFYHSSAKPTAIIGKAKVVRAGYPDDTQWDPKSNYYDPKAKRDEPRWYMVDIKADGRFKRDLTLEELKGMDVLSDMVLVQKGSRLSVQPVTPEEWKAILAAGRRRKR